MHKMDLIPPRFRSDAPRDRKCDASSGSRPISGIGPPPWHRKRVGTAGGLAETELLVGGDVDMLWPGVPLGSGFRVVHYPGYRPTMRVPMFSVLVSLIALGVDGLDEHVPEYFQYSLMQSKPCPADLGNFGVGSVEGAVADAVHEARALVEPLRKKLQAPSAVVTAIQGGVELFSEYTGSVKPNATQAPDGQSGYCIGSVTKIFTSIMLFQLRDAGRLPQGLDTAVSAVFPGWVDPAAPDTSNRPITLRALAMHTSGLAREVPACPGCDEAAILSNVSAQHRAYAMFSKTSYSNLGIAALGRALEKVVNMSWEDWVVSRIMRPLGMNHSGVDCTPQRVQQGSVVVGVDPSTGHVTPPPSSWGWSAPCGSAFSTPADMRKFMAFLLGDAPKGGEVLDAATLREMRNTGFLQRDGISSITSATFEAAVMRGRWSQSKLGCIGGYRAAISLIPSLDLAVFAAAASTCDIFGDGDALAFPVQAVIQGPIQELLAKKRAKNATLLSPRTDDFLGSYDCGGPSRIAINEQGILTLFNGPGGNQSDGQGYPFLMLWRPGLLGPARAHEAASFFGSDATSHADDTFLLDMGSTINDSASFLPEEWEGCHDEAAPGANLCPVSCYRRMARGDAGVVSFVRNSTQSVLGFWVNGKGGDWGCTRV